MDYFNSAVSTVQGAVASAAEGAKGLAQKVMPSSDAKDALSEDASRKAGGMAAEPKGKTMTGGRRRRTRRQHKKRKTHRRRR